VAALRTWLKREALDAEEVLAAVEPLVDRRIRARGGLDEEVASEPWTREAPLLAGLGA
jgi:hypothetical protein